MEASRMPDFPSLPATLHEAKRKVARVAMADLIGTSEPPDGYQDEYPFNALAHLKVFPEKWRQPLHDVIRFVYRYEKIPPESPQETRRRDVR